MPRPCTICVHQDREQIDAELLEGKPYKQLAARFGGSSSALHRHGQTHLPERLRKARDAVEISKADSLVQQVEALQTHARQVLAKAESDGDHRTVLAVIRELARLTELVAKFTRELNTKPNTVVNVELVDDATAQRMAEFYLDNHKKELS